MATVTSNTPESTLTTARTESKPPAGAKAPSARKQAWRRYFRTERRRFRESLTREQLISTLKTLAWVIPLTLLIWIYAEREQVATLDGISIPIDVTTTDATRIVTLEDPADRIVRADVRGPRSNIERLRRQIAPGSAIRLDIDPGLSTGRIHELRAAALLNNHPDFWNYGITVRNADPSNLQVYVDELEEREVPVRVPPGIENLAGPPVFVPSAVTVSGPRQALDRARERGELAVYANLADLDILNRPGEYELPSVRLTRSAPLQQDPNVKIEPETVRVTLQVRARDIEHLIRSMPVYVMAPSSVIDGHRVEHDEFVSNVTVVGTPEAIELLPGYRPVAVIELQPGDVQLQHLGQWRSRPVRIDLPQGVRLTEESARREIRFRLIERGAADE